MDINASIIDQRVTGLAETLAERATAELGVARDETRLKSLAFVYLCVKSLLDLEDDDAFDALTEGGGDFGIDAFHVSEVVDGEFTVTLFQAKYKKRLDGQSNFPATAIKTAIEALRHMLDPGAKLAHINDRLRARVEDTRSLIREGYIPFVRVIACNNGLSWNAEGQEAIDAFGLQDRVSFEHCNHDTLVGLQLSNRPVDEKLNLAGKSIVEDLNYSRVLVGRMQVEAIADLIARHGDRLLERNIRRFLGLHRNRVNEDIQHTLESEDRSNFYFYNNGITMTCDDFTFNAFQKEDLTVNVKNLQIINGGQTAMTIARTLSQRTIHNEAPASVMVRLYKLPSENEDLVRRITYATNSQNPVDLRDLRANETMQQRLELDIDQLGYSYRRKRSDASARHTDISSGTAAEAVLAVWRRRPHQARYFSREHFGKLYDVIFTDDLTGAQVIVAVLLYRIAENRRKRPHESDPAFVRYASCFAAMQMGQSLLRDLGNPPAITHQNFTSAVEHIERQGDAYFDNAIDDIERALTLLYGKRDISLQQLAATFRRADLIEHLTAAS